MHNKKSLSFKTIQTNHVSSNLKLDSIVSFTILERKKENLVHCIKQTSNPILLSKWDNFWVYLFGLEKGYYKFKNTCNKSLSRESGSKTKIADL